MLDCSNCAKNLYGSDNWNRVATGDNKRNCRTCVYRLAEQDKKNSQFPLTPQDFESYPTYIEAMRNFYNSLGSEETRPNDWELVYGS
jgi:uncharacterized protein YozE (UPF0346 family)